MSAVAAGLIAGAGIRLIGALGSNVMGRVACGLFGLGTFVSIGFLHVPLLGVLLGFGGAACAWAWWRLRPADGGRAP
jgi:chromate transporter